jgi:hypothetical protein
MEPVMQIVLEKDSKKAILIFKDAVNLELIESGLYADRNGFLHISSNTHEIVAGNAPEHWASNGSLKYIDGAWVIDDSEKYQEAVNENTNLQSAQVRQKRNELLTRSDWTQVADAPVDKAAWAAYRQALRDISSQEGFPWTIEWPTQP